jgi:hypothetical protein
MIIAIITHESKYLAKHINIPKIDEKRIDIKRIFPFQQLKKEGDRYWAGASYYN